MKNIEEIKKIEQIKKEALSNFNEWYQIEPRLAEYEAFAWKNIKEAGFPTEWESFCEAFDATKEPPEIVEIANSIFYGIEAVRKNIAEDNPEHAALAMMRLCNKGFSLNFSIIEPVYVKGQKFDDGPKNKRMDKLSKAMLESLKEFCEKNKRRPTARELAKYLPTDKTYIQEVEEDEYGDIVIYWKRPNGAPVTTSFKSFQDRYTRILDKNPEIKKRY